MRNPTDMFKALQLIAPQLATATVTGTAVNFEPNNDSKVEAFAIVNTGAIGGTPDSYTVIYTIEQSATSGGTYTVSGTFATGTSATQNASKPVTLDPTKPWVRAKATIAFVNGTSPSIAISANIFVKQNNASINNQATLS